MASRTNRAPRSPSPAAIAVGNGYRSWSEQLANDYPLVRYFARHAVERITGAPLPVDMNAPGADILKSAQSYLSESPHRSPAQ